MATPAAQISVNGKAVASLFDQRLISVTVTDKEGITSDTVSCELADGNPFISIPTKGDLIRVSLGYRETGLADFGTYIADDPEVRCLPYGITVNGKGANMREQFKQPRSRHWDNKTVKEIVSQIASENGWSAAIDDAIGSHRYTYIAQEDESDQHFLERLKRRHDALFSVKDGRLVFAACGTGRAISGRALPSVRASRDNIIEGTCRTTFSLRHKFRKVKARTQDREKAELIEVEEDSDEEGEADYTIAEPFADEEEARKAAGAKARDLKRETIRTSVTLRGSPEIRAGALLFYHDVRPELDPIDFIIESATHRISKSGYTVDVEARLYVPAKGGGGGSGGGSGSGGDPSSPSSAGNSPRPKQFASPRSLGDNRKL